MEPITVDWIRNTLLTLILSAMVGALMGIGRMIQAMKNIAKQVEKGDENLEKMTDQNHRDHRRIIDEQVDQGNRLSVVETRITDLCDPGDGCP